MEQKSAKFNQSISQIKVYVCIPIAKTVFLWEALHFLKMQHRLPYKPSNRVRTNYKTLTGKKVVGKTVDVLEIPPTFSQHCCDCKVDLQLRVIHRWECGWVFASPCDEVAIFIVLHYYFIHSSFWTAVTHCELDDASVFNTTHTWKEGSEARTASSLSLARVRPSAITNGTNKHSSTTGSSSSSTSSSHSKTQRSASTYHRQRRHSDFCESLFWPLHFIADFPPTFPGASGIYLVVCSGGEPFLWFFFKLLIFDQRVLVLN